MEFQRPNRLAGSVGQLVGERYRLESLLGRGGMGEVWRATHVLTRRPAALKFLRSTLAHRADMRQRFLREARAAAVVSHPNVAEVVDAFAIEDGTLVLVMPLLEGETLRALVAREAPLALEAALELLLPLISAVGTAHSRGVVHRDLKPENVFLAEDAGGRTLKVLDFGIAKLTNDDSGEDVTLTGVGTLMGTPYYMAPEQSFGGRDQDYRVDIWSIGVIAYELLSGSRPIEGENTSRVLRNLLAQGITPLEQLAPDLPAHVSKLVMSMLARERSDRPHSLRDVYLMLDPEPPGTVRSHALPGEPQAACSSVDPRPSPLPTELKSPAPEQTAQTMLGRAKAYLARLLAHTAAPAEDGDTLVSQRSL